MIGAGAIAGRVDFPEAGHEDALVLISIDKCMSRVAVSANGGELVGAILVLEFGWSANAMGAAFDGDVIGGSNIVDLQGNIGDAVAVEHEPLHVWMRRP